MKTISSDIIIVGTGAGGATVGKEISKKNGKILFFEKGGVPQRLGSELCSVLIYDKFGLLCKSREGILLYRSICCGGTTIVSCANAIDNLEYNFNGYNLDLKNQIKEAYSELKVNNFPVSHMGLGIKRMLKVTRDINLNFRPTLKFIDFSQCRQCGNCIFGCKYNAKWTALNFLEEAKKNGAKVLTNSNVTKVLISKGRAIGVEGFKQYEKFRAYADKIIISAGGIGTPVILKKSGINEAGNSFFCDLFTNTYGIYDKDIGFYKEPLMSIIDDEFYKTDGFILSSFSNRFFTLLSLLPIRHILNSFSFKRMVGIMVKISDDSLGKVHENGLVEKIVTEEDRIKLKKGELKAIEALNSFGIDSSKIFTSKIAGAHPGGTAAIGKVVDINLQTRIKNLFICDASVFPISPGFPPILLIVALAKKLSNFLLEKS